LFEHHVVAGVPMSPPPGHEHRVVGIDQVVRRAAPKGLRHGGDPLLAAFQLDKGADRRLVHRDHDVLVGELLAVLLVAEPRAIAELAELAGAAGGVGPSGDGAAVTDEQTEAPVTAAAPAPTDNGKAGSKKDAKKGEKEAAPAAATAPDDASGAKDAGKDTKAAKRSAEGAAGAPAGVGAEAVPMEMDADAEVDPVLLAKEFSGLLQVARDDDEADS